MDDERDSPTGRSRSIVPRPAGAIRSELALLALIIGTLVATCNVLLAIHRHADTTPRTAETPSTVALNLPRCTPDVRRGKSPIFARQAGLSRKPAIVQQPSPPVEALPPPEDPTTKVVAGLTNATSLEIEAAQQADRRATALETALKASEAESRRWKRREMLVRQQISGADRPRPTQLESRPIFWTRNATFWPRNEMRLKAALAKAGQRSGPYSVLPYKGAKWNLATADRARMHVRRRSSSSRRD